MLLITLIIFLVWVVFGIKMYTLTRENKESQENIQHSQNRRQRDSLSVTISYANVRRDNDGRTLNGRPLETKDDWDRWWVIKGKCDGYIRRLSEIERSFNDLSQADPDDLLEEWKWRYEELKSLCQHNGMWNNMLGDRLPYIPTSEQRHREQQLILNVEKAYRDGKAEREMYQFYKEQILAYLMTQPGHKIIRKELFKHFKQDDSEKNKQFRRIFNRLVDDRVLSNRKNKDGNYYVRKSPKRAQKEAGAFSLSASSFEPMRFAYVDKRLLYKVEYTVGTPFEVDRVANTCKFISQTSGETYHASLSECTCPYFATSNGQPCKHMLALALHLGYISRSDARFR